MGVPSIWAWTGGLWDALLPTLYFGFPIVATRGRFAPERAFDILPRGLPIAALILWLMGQAGTLWWFWAWSAWTAFNLLLSIGV